MTGGEFPITSASGNQTGPAIYGNIVVWQDDRYGSDDICACNLSTAHSAVSPLLSSSILLVVFVGALIIVVAVLLSKKKQGEKTKKEEISYTDVLLNAMKGIKSEILLYGIVIAVFLITLACFNVEVVRELKWVFVIVLTICLLFYFLMKREESVQKRREAADHKPMGTE